LVVFVNAIGNDQSWQWAWMESSGAGYPDATAAITAAIQHRLTASDLIWPPADLMPEESEQSVEPEYPLWKTLFRRK
jgi:hypothetical protein